MIDVPVHPELAKAGSLEHLRLGRAAPHHDPRTLRLASYLDDAVVLPDVPAEADWTAGVASWPMYGNDRLGDCTCAAAGHLVQAWTAGVGSPRTPDGEAVEGLYWATGKSDDGRYEVDVLNYWRQDGMGGDRIAAYAYVDPQNLDHVKAAIWLFGGVYAGIALPQTAQGQPVWDVAGDPHVPHIPASPGSWGGHAVPYVGFGSSPLDPSGNGHLRVVTWGGLIDATEAFHLAYCDELYAPISTDFLNAAGQTPQGFDLAALQADLAHVTRAGTAAPVPAAVGDPGGYTWNG